MAVAKEILVKIGSQPNFHPTEKEVLLCSCNPKNVSAMHLSNLHKPGPNSKDVFISIDKENENRLINISDNTMPTDVVNCWSDQC